MYLKIKDFFKQNWIYLFIFVIVFSLRVTALNNKTTFYFDDTASLSLSTMNNYDEKNNSWVKFNWADMYFARSTNYTVLDIKKILYESKSDIKEIWKDITTLHSKTIDRQHPNLYYSILRIWTAGMDYSNSKKMLVRACSLNLVFFIFSFFFMYKLLSLIKQDKKFISLGLFFAFITTGSISNSLLIRPYPMYETFFILATYNYITLYFSTDNKKYLPINKILTYSLSFALLMLSHYYSLILIFIFVITISIRCIIHRNKNLLISFYIIVAGAFLLVLLFCPLYFINFTDMEHLDKTVGFLSFFNFTDKGWLVSLTDIFCKYLFNNNSLYIILFVLPLFSIPVLNNNKFEKIELKKLYVLYTISFLYCYIVCIIAPFKEDQATRYYMCAYPTLTLLLAFVTYYFRWEWVILCVTIYFLSTLYPIKNITNANLSLFKNMEDLQYYREFNEYKRIKTIIRKKQNRNLPVVFVGKPWDWPNYILYMPNYVTVRFEDDTPANNYVFNKYILIDNNDLYLVTEGNKQKLFDIDK